MARKKSYSSELSKIHDTAVLLAQQIRNFTEPMSMLIADSERLHEIEPLLDNLRKVTNVVLPETTIPINDITPPGSTPAEPVKRFKRAKKIISEAILDTPSETD